MKEKDLKIKLTQIKCYPSASWKAEHRELLLAQIDGTYKSSKKAGEFFSGLKALIQSKNFQLKPAWSVLLIIVTVFASGVLSLHAARDSRPGEALYIAKRISEQTQLALTFNEKQRAKLGIEFASKRAQELNQVLKEEKSPNEREKHVEQLTQDFKKQIIVAKKNLEKISVSYHNNLNHNNLNQKTKIDNKEKQSEQKNEVNNVNNKENKIKTKAEKDQGQKIFSANLGKDNKRIEIAKESSGLEQDNQGNNDNKAEQDNKRQVEDSKEEKTASTTSQKSQKQTDNNQENNKEADLEQVNKILAEAQQLIENDDIQATVDKLEQANKIINQIEPDNGEVKGVEESATDNATSSENIETKAENTSSQETASSTE